ncbi:MAG: hypothetical protein V1827_05485 [Candidatus Micrarchaeota archaeon]
MHQPERRVSGPVTFAAGKRFGRYGHESESIVRDVQVRETEGFKAIMKAWMTIVDFPDMRQLYHDISNPAWYAREALKGKRYSAEDIGMFAVAVGAYQHSRAFGAAGQFISVLINDNEEGEFAINSRHLSAPFTVIGYRNTKNFVIEGDAGRWLGMEMTEGRILVRGDSGESIGRYMSGGIIEVEGDSGANTGECLAGGEVIVKGRAGCAPGYGILRGKVEIMKDAGDRAGDHMEGGELVIHGNAGISTGRSMKSGKITVYGDVGDFLGGFETQRAVQGYLWMNPPFVWRNPLSSLIAAPTPPKRDGEIIVHGNAGEKVGENMEGGVIRLYGDYKSIGRNIKGRVYHKDRLIAGTEPDR